MTDPLFDYHDKPHNPRIPALLRRLEARGYIASHYGQDRYRDGWRNGFLIGSIATAIFIMAVVVGIAVS